jgi:hypothetical protein
MSDDTPTEPTKPVEPTEHTAPLEAFETVGPTGSAGGGSRRGAVIAGVAVAVVAVLGGGAYGVYAFLNGGGPQPADVLPSSTVALVSVDLDPSAGQKIAAIKSIRKFPILKESLGLDADDDLREFAFDEIVAATDCTGLDFDRDVKPWLGKRGAVAAVDLGESNPSPAIVLQINDQAEAEKGFRAFVECTDPEDFAFEVGEDYLVASDSPAHAKAILDDGARKPLADDAAYRKWTDEAGDAGVMSFYVAPRAADYAEELLDEFGSTLFGFGNDGFTLEGDDSDPMAAAKDALDEFKGLAGTVRFNGGGMEMSLATGGLTQLEDLVSVGSEMGELPADTAVALGFGVAKGYAEKLLDPLGDDVAAAEEDTGLDLPEDLQTLLGRAVILSLGGDVPSSFDDIEEIEDVPAGLLIHGDAEKIEAIITKAEESLGMYLSDIPLVVEGSGDKLAIATSSDYADALLESGKLASDDGFRAAVPNADEATGIIYLDFESPWRDSLIDLVTGEEGDDVGADVEANTEPLRSFGLSSWQDGDTSHVLLKIAAE